MDNELANLKAQLEAIKNENLIAKNEFAKRLIGLGFDLYSEIVFDHPTEKGLRILFSIPSYFGGENNTYGDFFRIMVQKPHVCDDECNRDCDCEWDNYRWATAEEIISVLRIALMGWIEREQESLQNNWEAAKALPLPAEIDAIRRRVENELRQNRKNILPVARLLDLI